MWTNSQTSQPGKPLSRIPPEVHDRVEPPDCRRGSDCRYVNGMLRVSPLEAAGMVLAAWSPPCMATSATPGSLST